MKKCISVILVIIGISLCVSTSSAEEVSVVKPDQPIVDWNKSDTELDSEMCWAYAILNMIQFSWHNSTEPTKNLFKALYKRYGNAPHRLPDAMSWIWYEYLPHDEKFSDRELSEMYMWAFDLKIGKPYHRHMMWIKGALLQNRVVAIGIITGENNIGHILTCYAYRYHDGKHQLAIADSDDKKSGAFWNDVYQRDGKWYMKGYDNMYIHDVYSMLILE